MKVIGSYFEVLKSFLIFLCLLGTHQVFAQENVFLWDNQESFIKASNCEVNELSETGFRLSNYYGSGSSPTENLRNANGVRQSYLTNYSLVKLNALKGRANYVGMQVVGVNQGTNHKETRWSSEREDIGFLYYRSLLALNDSLLKSNLSDSQILDFQKLTNLKVESIYLELLHDDNASSLYQSLKCNDKDREYIVFRAYAKSDENQESWFYLAISTEETQILQNIETLKKTDFREIVVSYDSMAKLPNYIDTVDDVSDDIDDIADDSSDDSSSDTPLQDTPVASLNQVVCARSGLLNIRDDELERVLFKGKTGEKVKVFQSWNEQTTKEKVIGGVLYTFQKIEFPDREEQDERVGYAASQFITNRSDCPYIQTTPTPAPVGGINISGLNDSKCCHFPTVKAPTHSYTSGMQRFGAGRSGGRLHAACDLYRYEHEPAKSVAAGEIIREMYYFYQGTYALEVKHQGGFVVRYGELTSQGASQMKLGKKLSMGDRVGYIGKVNSNCCRPMLHFELYQGNRSGGLSNGTAPYRRRSDLLNPTNYLLNWQNKAF